MGSERLRDDVRVAAFYADLLAQGRDEATIISYNTNLNRFLMFIEAEKGPLSDHLDPTHRGGGVSACWNLATQLDISNFKKWLVASYKNSTVNQTLKLNKAFINWLIENHGCASNPIDHISRPPVSPPVTKWLSDSEQNRLLQETRRTRTIDGKAPTVTQSYDIVREQAIVMTFLRAGLRVAELCDMTLDCVTINERSNGSKFYVRGKGDKDREVPIGDELRALLIKYRKSRKDNPSPYLFPSRRSEKCTTRAIEHMIEGYSDRLRIEHLTCHALRHTFGHDLTKRGVPLDVIARLMGHFKKDGSPNIAMTMKYTTPGYNDLEDAVNKLNWD